MEFIIEYFTLILGDGNWKFWLEGISLTLMFVSLSLLIGGVLSIPLAIARANRHPIFNPMVWSFTYFFRGTPLLVQTYLLYYGLPQFDFVKDSFMWPMLREATWCALIAFTLNTAAYTTEIFRGAIEAVPHGEIEAAKACGMSPFKRMRRIILPSALRISLPAYSNEVIFMLHGSVILGVLPIIDIFGAAKTINSRYYVSFEGFIPCAILYMILVFGITRIFRMLEKRYHAHLRPRTS
ncbi:ABC transporter permease [Aestuariispira insulae]|uniref:Arginine/ornithine transport system permease protein n=1 Tax=Aestuariispira insulae TaxID=1461337 RepID=A0A3D9HIC8_9PROT|nr:ABC transporter permease [Aestuariispira insulae]RED49185.1 arginine/ornithine transport system permease protein [Aestuariispira insulae]